MLLSPDAVFNIDRKAGLVQVTDFPERLDRVALYLDTVHDRVHRQVQIDVADPRSGAERRGRGDARLDRRRPRAR